MVTMIVAIVHSPVTQDPCHCVVVVVVTAVTAVTAFDTTDTCPANNKRYLSHAVVIVHKACDMSMCCAKRRIQIANAPAHLLLLMYRLRVCQWRDCQLLTANYGWLDARCVPHLLCPAIDSQKPPGTYLARDSQN